MFAAGTYAGAGNGERVFFPYWLRHWAAECPAVGVSEHNGNGSLLVQTGLFPVRHGNPQHRIVRIQKFSAHFLSVTGFFLCAYSMASARKWGIRLFTGLALILVSFTCGSRSAFPNALAGVTLCFFIYTSSVFRNNRKFYTASILFIILLSWARPMPCWICPGGGQACRPSGYVFLRQPAGPVQTGLGAGGPGSAVRSRQPDVHQSFHGVFLRSQPPQFCPPRIRTSRLRLRLCRAGADADSAGPVSYFRTPERSEIVRRTSTAQSPGTGGVLRIVHRRFPRLWRIHLA